MSMSAMCIWESDKSYGRLLAVGQGMSGCCMNSNITGENIDESADNRTYS